MANSPGHQQHPAHRVNESRAGKALLVELDGQVIAESDDVVVVDEDGTPRRCYFARSAMHNGTLELSARVTHCPYKGTATYYDLVLGSRRIRDAVWSYTDPYDEHLALKERIAFHDDEHPELRLRSGAAETV